jgi:hypothetical protein
MSGADGPFNPEKWQRFRDEKIELQQGVAGPFRIPAHPPDA